MQEAVNAWWDGSLRRSIPSPGWTPNLKEMKLRSATCALWARRRVIACKACGPGCSRCVMPL